MSNIELVLADLDGTLAEVGKHEASENVREAIITCEEKGIKVVPVTGRYYEDALPLLTVLGIEGPGVFDNGASILDIKTGQVLWSRWFKPEQVQEIALKLLPFAVVIDYELPAYIHVPAENEADIIRKHATETSSIFARLRLQDQEALEEQLKDTAGITHYYAPSTDGDETLLGVQITREGADKFHGVHALRDILHISLEATLGIGDGSNDLALFRNSGTKVAMGNAVNELKAAADHVVASVSEDGFAEAMQRFVL